MQDIEVTATAGISTLTQELISSEKPFIIHVMSELNTEIEVLTLARIGETESIRRYLEFALQTEELAGKNMFIRLAMDELMHQDLLGEKIDEYHRQGSCTPVSVSPTLIEKLIPKITQRDVLSSGRANAAALSALQIALELENNARKFYLEQSEKVNQKSLRLLFQRLGEMESAHQQLIQGEIDFIEETGFWLGFREFTLETNR
ncbi:MAG: ferritin family protein [candidate division WOR-3 bacterium]